MLQERTSDHDLADAQAILQLDEVDKVFRSSRGEAIAGLGKVSARFHSGEFIAIVGASGCGKSTLLRIVGGLVAPSSGRILYRDKTITGPVEDMGIVFQRPVLLDWLTVEKNITLQLRMRNQGTSSDQSGRARNLLARVNLVGYQMRYPWELSGGQQQRVSLCRALIHQPSLLLMDEPFGALDALTREQLQADLERLWIEQRPTVLFVTHDVGEAVTLADRVLVLAGRPGVVVEDIRVQAPRPRGNGLLDNAALQADARRVRKLLSEAEPAKKEGD